MNKTKESNDNAMAIYSISTHAIQNLLSQLSARMTDKSSSLNTTVAVLGGLGGL